MASAQSLEAIAHARPDILITILPPECRVQLMEQIRKGSGHGGGIRPWR